MKFLLFVFLLGASQASFATSLAPASREIAAADYSPTMTEILGSDLPASLRTRLCTEQEDEWAWTRHRVIECVFEIEPHDFNNLLTALGPSPRTTQVTGRTSSLHLAWAPLDFAIAEVHFRSPTPWPPGDILIYANAEHSKGVAYRYTRTLFVPPSN